MKIVELLGLPSVGKSYVLKEQKYKVDNLINQRGVSVQFVESGVNFKKVKNIALGFLCLFFSQPLVFLHALSEKNKKLLLLCERVGRTKNAKGVLFDEGIMQACWAVFLNGRGDNTSLLALNLIKRISNDISLIIYVSANKVSIFERSRKRLKANPKTAYNYYSIENYADARDAMACLLKVLRGSGISLKFIKN